MNDQVALVKLRTDIVSIIGERIELKRAGRNYKALCPFHGEKTPSFMVSPELQIFKCFGCDAKGDVFAFLEQYEGMEFGEALKYLAERAGIKLVRANFGVVSEKEKLIEIHAESLKFYKYILTQHPIGKRALEYLLKDRGLAKSTIEEFQLGYSPENSTILNKFLVEKKKFAKPDIERSGIGIVRGQNLYDRFNGRIIFPLFDHRGNPIGFSGRVLPWDKRETGKYINSPETPIYHKSSVLYGLNLTRPNIKKKKVAIVVEGELDLISSYQAGIKNVVAIKGSVLTEDQVRLLSRFAPKFILALDSDFAGDAAARRGITVAGNLGIEVKIAKISKFKDPDEAARGDIESFKSDLIHSIGVWDFLIDSIFSRFDAGSGAGKAKISKELVPILREIEDKIVQAHYANVVAKKLSVPLSAVSEQLEKAEKKETLGSFSPPSQSGISEGRRKILEERLVAISFRSEPSILIEIEDLISQPLHRKLIEEYRKYISKNKNFSLSDFGNSLPGELFSGFAEMVLAETKDLSDDPDEIKKELDLIQKELKIIILKDNLKSLAILMRKLEDEGDKDKLLKAQNKFSKIAKKLSGYEEEDIGGIILSEP